MICRWYPFINKSPIIHHQSLIYLYPISNTLRFVAQRVKITVKRCITQHYCEATGATKLEFATCHNVTAQAFADGATYLQLMERNVQALREALN